MPSFALASADLRIAIHPPAEAELAGLVALVNALAAEAAGLFIMPIDGSDGVAAVRLHLASVAHSGNEAIFVASCDGEIAGLLTAARGIHPAKRGVAEIGIGVAAAHRRRGVGQALMTRAERWALDAGIHRLELSVVTDNHPAIALYRRAGYEIEGVRRASAKVAGRAVDQLMMAKLLTAGPAERAGSRR
jgi:RimJ/RimL family protein N-acetyltransferase